MLKKILIIYYVHTRVYMLDRLKVTIEVIIRLMQNGDRKKAHWKKAHRKKAHRKKAHMYISAREKNALGKKRTRKKAHTEKSALG